LASDFTNTSIHTYYTHHSLTSFSSQQTDPPSSSNASAAYYHTSWQLDAHPQLLMPHVPPPSYEGLESALRAMVAMEVDFGILMETKITGGIYT
jgi:hypothetical protein